MIFPKLLFTHFNKLVTLQSIYWLWNFINFHFRFVKSMNRNILSCRKDGNIRHCYDFVPGRSCFGTLPLIKFLIFTLICSQRNKCLIYKREREWFLILALYNLFSLKLICYIFNKIYFINNCFTIDVYFVFPHIF